MTLDGRDTVRAVLAGRVGNTTRRESVTLRLPSEMLAGVKREASATGQTISDVVEKALGGRPRRYAVSAAVTAQPLVAVGYRVGKAVVALGQEPPDLAAADADLQEVRDIVAAALRGVREHYDAELDAQGAERREGWKG